MRRPQGAADAGTGSEKHAKRGADLVTGHDPERVDGAGRADGGRAGAPYMYAETLIMMAAAPGVAMGVRCRQLQGMLGGITGASNAPALSRPHKRISRPGADISRDSNWVVTVSDRRGPRVLALDSSGLKQHNRSEWTGAKWGVRRGFVKMHVLAGTWTMKILAPGVTDDAAGDPAMFESLPGQVADAGGAGEGGGAPRAEPPAAPGLGGGGPGYGNLLASGVPPPPPPRSRHSFREPPGTGPRPISCLAMPRTAQGGT